ncbi:hypothetical protein LCGC14_2214790 [marine sediment metagenome]|uniref:Uncharacterized protein n=1 Tax=marine sediment metagenome TaxID=412755 RepID=A0A0F9DCW7_9ZZZZ
MAFIADHRQDFEMWDYIQGDIYKDMSIVAARFLYLEELSADDPLKISLRDPYSDKWTKWVKFPELLLCTAKAYGRVNHVYLSAAIDVHRSILKNEIIIESDYPTYEENYAAAKVIGKIIEGKGFEPMYYYSGNKSVHIHVFFDWDCLDGLDPIIQDQLRLLFKGRGWYFKRKFMEWLRTKMISCWDTDFKKFDKDLIRANHLIRCELSKNKLGYKAFLGYSYKDMSFVPYICNEKNKIYPEIGKIRLSSPHKIQEIVEEFIENTRKKTKLGMVRKKNNPLSNWGINISPESLRECVKVILSEDFQKAGDGLKRGFFILLNELKRVFEENQAKIIIHDWNAKMGFPLKDHEINYRLKIKDYSLSCDYVHNFLKEVGIDVSEKCKGKVYI